MNPKAKTPEILIIEDEVDTRFYLMTLVRSLGFDPILAKDGVQGLDLLARSRPCLIILDIMMPNKGGSRVYEELLASPDFRHIPVLFFSGVDRQAFFHYLKMLNAGSETSLPEPRYYVAKNADPDYLKSIITQAIQENQNPPVREKGDTI